MQYIFSSYKVIIIYGNFCRRQIRHYTNCALMDTFNVLQQHQKHMKDTKERCYDLQRSH